MRHKINLQIEFDVEGENVPDFNMADVAAKAHDALHAYEDGRYPFYIEMLQLALDKAINGAIHDAALDALFAKYGNEAIEHENGSTSKAYLEFEKLKFKAFIRDGEETKFTP